MKREEILKKYSFPNYKKEVIVPERFIGIDKENYTDEEFKLILKIFGIDITKENIKNISCICIDGIDLITILKRKEKIMNFVTIEKESSLNGEGLRNVLWVTGCSHKCKGCHNPETWDCNYGTEFTKEVNLPILIDSLRPDYITGLTLSGGDPFFIDNIEMILEIIKAVRKEFGQTKTIWLYTGYKVEDLMDDVDANDLYAVLTNLYKNFPEILGNTDFYDYTKNYYSSLDYHTKMKVKSILKNIDVLVDGEFEEDKKIEGLRYKGSYNQKIINMQNPSDILFDEKLNIKLTKEILECK